MGKTIDHGLDIFTQHDVLLPQRLIACLQRMPASTVAIWRSERSIGMPRSVKFQTSPKRRRSIVAAERGAV